MSTAPAADTPTPRKQQQHKQKPEQRRHTVYDDLDLRTTEEIATADDAAYGAALALLDGEYR